MFKSPIHPRPVLAMIAVCLGTFMLIIDVQIVVVAMPSIRSALHTSFAQEQWTIDAYSVTLAALLLPAGSISDILGRRRMFALGLTGFTIGSLLCGLAASGSELILFRVIQAVGGAIVFSTSVPILVQTFTRERLGAMLGIWGAVVNLGLGCGPVLGGLLTEISWRWIFFANIPIGIIAIALTLAGVHESSETQSRRIDVLGGAVFTIGLVGLITGLIEAGDGWTRPIVPTALGIAAAALIAFPIIEHARRQPMFDLSLFRKPAFIGGLTSAIGMNGSIYAVLLYLVLYLQEGLHTSPLLTGVQLLVITIAAMLASIVGGRLGGKVPARAMLALGLGLIGIGLLLMGGLTTQSTWTALVPGMIAAGIGSGLVNAPLASTAVGVTSPKNAGMASGINSAFRQIGIAVSVAVLGTVFNSIVTAHPTTASYASALNSVLNIAACIALAAAVLALILVRERDFYTRG